MNRNLILIRTMVIIFLFLFSSLAFAQTLPEGPIKGEKLFETKGCLKCHAIKGEGGRKGPDLGATDLIEAQLDLATKIWNHAPLMMTEMEREKVVQPTLTGQDFSEISAYLYFIGFFDEPGNSTKGRSVFEEKSCYLCHLSSGKGWGRAPGLDEFPRDMSPIFLSQGLWNHGLTILTQMSQIGIKWPKFTGTEIMDLLKYIQREAKGAKEGAFFKYGNPRKGKEIFHEKGCNNCHSVYNEGAQGGVDLGRVAKTSYTSSSRIASSMWNKGPRMLAQISQIQSGNPTFTYEEMADLLTYLYFLRFIDEPGDPKRGRSLFSEKRCSTCHDLYKQSGQLMHINLSKYENKPQTEIVASIWNHSMEIYKATKEKGIPWPQFKKGEMADLLEFIRSPEEKQRGK